MKFPIKISIALLLGIAAANSFCQCVTTAAPKVGEVPPPLQLSQIVQGPDRKEITWDRLKGKVVVLEFWNTACGPCIQAIPHLNELVEKFRGKPVVFISVSDDNADLLKQFLQKRPIHTWLTLDNAFSPTKAAYGIYGIPTTFIIDPSGHIAAITHPATLEAKHLDELLAGKPSSLPVPKPESTENSRRAVTHLETNLPPTKIAVSFKGPFPQPTHGAFNFRGWNEAHTIFEAKKAYLKDILAAFYEVNPKLVMDDVKLPEGLYDITAAAPPDQLAELRTRFAEVLKTNMAVSVQLTNRELEVYVMTGGATNAPGLRPVAIKTHGGGQISGGFTLGGYPMAGIASWFEFYFNRPVVDETGKSGLWDVELKWKMSDEELLPEKLDRGFWQLAETNPKAILSGNLPKELRGKITDHDLKLLQTELAKPDEQQCQPNPANVLQAAAEQLGLKMKPAKRKLQIVEVQAVEPRPIN